jgi:hypothetical protein
VWHPERARLGGYGSTMSAVTRPRGPLPPRVYWVRRGFVLLVVLVLLAIVWGLARLLGGGSDGGGGGGRSASPVVAEREPTSSPSATQEARSDLEARRERRKARQEAKEEEAPAKPSGPCLDSDVVVTPEVVEPYVGRPEVVLRLTSVESEACTWDVTSDSVFLVISDDKGPLWSSQDCPAAIPSEEVVVRQELAAEVEVAWNGKQSDRDCSEATDWVWPGEYVATAVARGAVTPVEVEFEMTRMVAGSEEGDETTDEQDDETTDQQGDEQGDDASSGTADQRGDEGGRER